MAGGVVQAISRLAEEVRRREDTSLSQLVEESGYPANRTLVTYEALRHEFAENPERIQSWLDYSDNSRASDSPWFKAPNDEMTKSANWIVGPTALAPRDQWQQFDSGADACAAYLALLLVQPGSQARPST